MDKMLEILTKLDKRWIYLMVFVAVMIPFFPGFDFLKQDFSITKETQAVYDKFESLNEGDAIYFDFAFDPTTQAELLPMAEQTIKHALDRKIKVFIYYSSLTGITLGENLIDRLKKMDKYKDIKEGVDYIHLGWMPIGVDMILFSAYSDFKATFNKDGEIFKGIKTFDDIDYVMCFAGSAYPESYMLVQRRFGFTIGLGITAVMGPDFVPYLQTGQADGMLNGLKGCAEYEKLRGEVGAANKGLASLTTAHFVMFLFIFVGNLIYFLENRRKKVRR